MLGQGKPALLGRRRKEDGAPRKPGQTRVEKQRAKA